MLNFNDLNILLDYLVKYFTGSYMVLALFICFVFIIILMVRGLDVRYSVTFALPLFGFFVAIGWFGTVTNSQWIVNMALIIVSVIYGTAIFKLLT